MSYVLSFGFKSKIYKQAPKVRIFLDDYFIDEFTIEPSSSSTPITELKPKTLGLNDVKPNRISPESAYKTLLENQITFDDETFFKMYELSENILQKKEHSITIDVFNKDNNFTNGFLNKTTLVALHSVFLIPTNILNTPKKFCIDYLQNVIEFKKTNNGIDLIKKFYRKKQEVYNLLNGKIFQNKKFYNKTTQKLEKIECIFWISEGIYTLNFSNEYVTTNINLNKQKAHLESLCLLANKYKQYANQRNHN